MSDLVQVKTTNPEVSRRGMMRSIALGLTAAGTMEVEAAQHVHNAAAEEKKNGGAYAVKAFQPHEYATIRKLAEIIVPADEVSGSAVDAGAPEFIDLLCSQNQQLAGIFHGGLAWLDAEMRKRHGHRFLDANAAQQTGMLDALVKADADERARRAEELVYERADQYKSFAGYTTTRAGELGPGLRFFDWMRRMAVDAFYTSPIGIKDVDYRGNKGMSKYEVPQAAIEYALKRSPFAG